MLIRRVARPLLSAVFIGQGIEALRSPTPAVEAARPTVEGLQKLPEPVSSKVPEDVETFAKIVAGVQIGGGVLLATGKLPRVASAALALTVIPGNLGSHMFWDESDPARKAELRRGFLTDLSLLGGLIIASVDTEGKPSLGWRGRRAARKVSDKVSSALPVGGAAAGGLLDSELAEKLQQGLHTGAERSRELAAVAAERAAERGSELAEVARDRGPKLAETAKKRGTKLAEVARDRSAELAEVALPRVAELAELARDRGSDLAEVARDRGLDVADRARDRSAELAEVARARSAELAAAAQARSAELAATSRKQARKQAKKAKKNLR
ncbi:DoxX family protein [Mycobacterium sp. MYCO198283]|uniref:DoxX family protein n=1 Tax=Mycobacterium sp. MYCO198283 TaxID=2883505 RepID=UPI001E48B41E|nr:DoxX family protein [Mycobacterium sp. MYCO198283]MCG5433365.1 DoxX family protein [Mycobacterium sp. MYCO198283]